MTNPILVEVTRGGTLESVHRGAVAVVNSKGAVLKALGDISRPNFPRSALKLLQAIPLVDSGAATAYAVSEEELALACASHRGEPHHVAVAEGWLRRLHLLESDLACGPHWPFDEHATHELIRAGKKPSRLHNNCSGKHSGFLTLAKHLGVVGGGYERPESVVQREVRGAVSRFCGLDADALPAGTDGCNAPILAVPTEKLALAMARIATGEGLSTADAGSARILHSAMRSHPNLVEGEGRLVTRLIGALSQGVAKAGAEGNFVAALPELGLGVALKIDDGGGRAADVAMVATLVSLGVLASDHPIATEFRDLPVLNTRGLSVGAIRPAQALRVF